MISQLSTDRRVLSMADNSTDYGGPHAIPIQPAVDLAAQLLPLAEARADTCPDTTSAGDTATGADTAGASENEGTQAEPADAGGSSPAGVPLVVGGLAASVLAGVGSVLIGRGGGGAGGGVVDPPADKLFSGPAALDLLHNAGLIEPVLNAEGGLVGYRPLGDLQRFIDSSLPWQPEFATPIGTPDGGTGTHLAGVAFQPGPDGTIASITVAVRPSGRGAPAASAPAATGPAQPPRSLARGPALRAVGDG